MFYINSEFLLYFLLLQNIKVGQNLVSLGLAEFDEDVHLEVTNVVTDVMKRQFLSVPLPSKVACLNAHVEEGEIDEDKSGFSPNKSPKYNSTASQSKVRTITPHC